MEVPKKAKILYKIKDNIYCSQFEKVILYLFDKGINICPKKIMTKKLPNYLGVVPTIVFENETIIGLENIIIYYEKLLNIDNLLLKAMDKKIE